MATSRSMNELARRFAIIAKAVEVNSLKTVQRAAISADQVLVIKTPVDTGRARSNWIVSIGQPSGTSKPTPVDPGTGANEALEQGRGEIGGYKLGRGGIFITNNVVYIVRLDNGYSAKAPAGMTAAALSAARRQFSESRLLRGV